MSPGLVSFVSVVVDDPSWMTSAAAERLARAEAVVRESGPGVAARILALAGAGKRVVRLFAGEAIESAEALDEARAVAEAGVAFEVLPGVGARGAALAFAGVPGDAVWAEAGQVEQAVRGRPAEQVVTVVARAGTPAQRLEVTTAGGAAAAAQALGGERVLVAFGAPDARLGWFQRRPLFGRRIVVTRARDQASAAAVLLREEGAEAISVPTIELHPPADGRPLDRALSELRAGHYEWVAFTSANGVERTWDALARTGGDARVFGWSRLAAIGPATARALEAHGLRADVVADEFRGEGLADAMLRAIGTIEGAVRVLVPRAAKARDVLPVTLEAAGCLVDVAPVYETRPPPVEVVEALVGELESGRIDAVTLTSSSTVENLCDLLGDRAPALLAKTRLASIGPITTRTAEARGLRVSVTAAEYTLPGLVRALGVAARGWGPPGAAGP